MANAVAGVGTTFERWSGAVWQTMAEINSIEGPAMDKENIEVTSLETEGGYDEFITGFMDGGTLTLNMNFTRSGYEVMKSDFEIDVARDYRITLPDNEDTTLEFEGLVIEIPLIMEAGDKLTVDVTIQVTGEVAIASAGAESAESVDVSSKDFTSEDVSSGDYGFYDRFVDPNTTFLDVHTPDSGNFTWLQGNGRWQIAANRAIPYVVGDYRYANFEAGSADIDIMMDMVVPTADYYAAGALIRYQSATEHWRVTLYKNKDTIAAAEIRVCKYNVVVKSVAVANIAGYGTLRVIVDGDYVTVYWRGTRVITNYQMDGAWNTVTKHGMLGYFDEIKPFQIVPIEEFFAV